MDFYVDESFYELYFKLVAKLNQVTILKMRRYKSIEKV